MTRADETVNDRSWRAMTPSAERKIAHASGGALATTPAHTSAESHATTMPGLLAKIAAATTHDCEPRTLRSPRFDGARFTGHADFSGVTFEGLAHFGGAEFDSAGFGRAEFNGMVDLVDATFRGPAEFDAATFCGDVILSRAWFATGVSFREAAFRHVAALQHARPPADRRARATLHWRCTDEWPASRRTGAPLRTPRARLISLRRSSPGDPVLSGIGSLEQPDRGARS